MSLQTQNTSANVDSALLLPRSPPLPFIYTAPPREWTLRTSFDPTSRSHRQRLRCFRAEIVTDHENSLIFILSIDYDTYPPSESRVSLALESTEIKSTVLFIGPPIELEGFIRHRAYIWGSIPNGYVRDKLGIELRISDDKIPCDSLFIGVLLVGEPRPGMLQNDSLSSNESPESEDPSLPASPSYENARSLSSHELKHDPSRPVVIGNAYDILLQDHQRIELRTRDFRCIVNGWTPAELAAGRRLVRFDRYQEGHVVHLKFTPHLPEETYDESSQVVISCIKWPETYSDFFITSFDVLRLAEFILKLPMNTEMKNRVRRNMATVPYVTLPKGKKPSSSHPDPNKDPFTLIMSFLEYQPRSIEKSIKVYDWEDLENCLAKILQRFIVADPEASPENIQFEHQLEAAKRLKRRKRRPALVTTTDPSEPQNSLRHETSPVEWPTITPTNTLQRPSVGRYVRRTPLPKLYLKPIPPRTIGPDCVHYSGEPSNGPHSSSSSNMSSYVWDRSISRKSSIVASSADYREDSSSAHSDSSDQSFFDTLRIPREQRGDTLPTSLPPPPTLSHQSSFEGPNMSTYIAPEGPILMNSSYHSSLESLTLSSKNPTEMYSGDWAQISPSHPQTPATPLSAQAVSNDIYVLPMQIPVPMPVPQPTPQLSASAYVARGGHHEVASNNFGSPWITEYKFPTQIHGTSQQECAWNGQEANNTIHPQQTYIAMEEDPEIAKINPDDWLNTEYIMSQEGLETEMTGVVNGQRYLFL